MRKAIMPKFTERGRVVLLVASFFIGLFFMFQACIYHDALWTYGYLRSMILDRDLNFYNEFMLHNSYFMYVPHPNHPMFYSGLCIFVLPFFLIGHLLASLLQNLPSVFTDGYSWPYTFLAGLSGVSAGIAAAAIMYRTCRRMFDGFSSLTAVVMVFWAGNMVFYTFVWPLYSHAFSVLVVSWFILFWLNTREERDHYQWALLGGILGLATWIRPQNALFACLPAWDLVKELARPRASRLTALGKGLCFAATALVCFAPQMFLWYKSSGKFIVDAYSEIGDQFFWWRPRFICLFFSLDKGLFTWTPVFLLAIPGCYLLQKRKSRVGWPLTIAFLLQAYLVASYEYPNGGAGFGARYLINCMPFLALCLAALVESIRSKVRLSFVIIGVCFFIFINLSMIVMYQQELIPHNEYTPKFMELVRLLVFHVPGATGEYIFSAHINQNVFARSFFTALGNGNPGRALLLLALFGAACAWLSFLVRGIFKIHPWNTSAARPLTWTTVLISVLVCSAIIALPSASKYRHVYPVLRVPYEHQEAEPSLNVREFFVDPRHTEVVIDIKFDEAVDFVDITSTTADAFEISHRTTLAQVTLIDDLGQQERFPIVYGSGTSDYSSFWTKSATETVIGKDKVVHHWLSRDKGTKEYHYGTGYFQRYELKHLRTIRQMRFDYIYMQGKLIVTGINLVCR